MRKIVLLVVLLVVAVTSSFMFACQNYYYDSYEGDSSGVITIENASVSLTTKKVEEVASIINGQAEALGGRKVRASENYYSDGDCYMSATFNIPKAKIREFVEQIEGIDGVKDLDKSFYTYDIVNNTSKLTAKKTALEQEITMLNTIISGTSEEKVAAIKEMKDVVAELEEINAELASYQNIEDYASVRVYVSEPYNDGFGIFLTITSVLAFMGLITAVVVLAIRNAQIKDGANNNK